MTARDLRRFAQELEENLGQAYDTDDTVREMQWAADEIDLLRRAIVRLGSEGRLDCVVAGKTTKAGEPAPLCAEIIGNPEQMCAGCATPTVKS